MTTISRVCRRCGVDTPVDQLVKCDTCKDGVQRLCRTCDAALSDEWAAANPERSRAIKAAYKKRDPERDKRQRHEYYLRHKEEKNAYRRQHYQDVKARELEAAKAYRESAKGKLVQRAAQRARKSRTKGAEGSYTSDDVNKQLKRQNGKCYWCGKPLGSAYEVDHVVPVSRGGSNHPSNLVMACRHCNASKSDLMPHEWHGSGGRLL